MEIAKWTQQASLPWGTLSVALLTRPLPLIVPPPGLPAAAAAAEPLRRTVFFSLSWSLLCSLPCRAFFGVPSGQRKGSLLCLLPRNNATRAPEQNPSAHALYIYIHITGNRL